MIHIKKNNKAAVFLIFALLLTPVLQNTGFSETHGENDTKTYISSVLKKFQELKKSPDADSYIDEITSIDNYLRQARQLFKDKKYDEAYYAANISDTYFRLIEAKKEYNDSQK